MTDQEMLRACHLSGQMSAAQSAATFGQPAQADALAGAAPALIGADAAVAQLRHLYRNLVEGGVRDTAQARRLAEGLLAPAIAALERAAIRARGAQGESNES